MRAASRIKIASECVLRGPFFSIVHAKKNRNLWDFADGVTVGEDIIAMT